MQAIVSARGFWLLWSALLLAKLALAARLPLFGDEAWYWLEGQRLAWAYSDLPGLTAWMIRAGVETFGSDRLAVRMPFVLLSMAIPLLLVATSRRWFGPHAGWLGGIAALLLPLLGGLGFLALPDVPLTFAVAACLYGLSCLRDAVEWRGLLWLGVGLVLGALSHYRFALLLMAGAVALLADPSLRRGLRERRMQGVLILGALAWLPLVTWNLVHGGAGLSFQLAERHPWQLHGGGAWFPLVQLVVVSPLLLLLLVATGVAAARRWRGAQTGPWPLIVLSAAIPLVVYGVLGFVADRERVSFHWTLQAYLPLLAALPLAWETLRPCWRIATLATAAAMLVAVHGFAWIAATPAWRATLAESRWYPDNFAGWDELAQSLRADARIDLDTLQADNFMLGAQLAFALDRPGLPIRDHALNHKHGRSAQLQLWQHAAPPPRNGVLVVEDSAVAPRLRLQHYQSLCRQLGRMGSPRVMSVDHGRKRFLLLDLESATAGCVLPALAWIDTPRRGEPVPRDFVVEGWAFKDGAGVAQIDITIDGVVVASADYGMVRPHVAEYWQHSADPAHPNVGFRAQVAAGDLGAGTHWLGLVVHGRDGSSETWPEQRIELQR
jgi:hypothetical protein